MIDREQMDVQNSSLTYFMTYMNKKPRSVFIVTSAALRYVHRLTSVSILRFGLLILNIGGIPCSQVKYSCNEDHNEEFHEAGLASGEWIDFGGEQLVSKVGSGEAIERAGTKEPEAVAMVG